MALSSSALNQPQAFAGRWKPPTWGTHRANLGIVLQITSNDDSLSGKVEFHDPHSEHVSQMLDPRLVGNVFTFYVDDEYVKGKLTFSMTLERGGKRARVHGAGGEMLLDFELARVPSSYR
jgi:hypothetical protein